MWSITLNLGNVQLKLTQEERVGAGIYESKHDDQDEEGPFADIDGEVLQELEGLNKAFITFKVYGESSLGA